MEEKEQQEGIERTQEIADNTTGQGTSQLYRDYMAGDVQDSSLTVRQKNRLAFEDAMKDVRPLTTEESRMRRHAVTASQGPVMRVALPEGYGESRLDRRISNPGMLEDLNEARARLQSNSAKLFNGLVKGFGIFATTAIDGLGVGMAATAATGAYEILSGGLRAQDGETSNDVWNRVQAKAQNNLFQRAVTSFNDWMERKLPNYYREGEQDRGFFQSLGSANFWGNEFVKNLGFMVGALVGAKVSAAGLGKLFNINKARNVVKSAVKAYKAETGVKDSISAMKLARAYASGRAEISGMRITETLGKAAKAAVRNEVAMTMAGGFMAADTEARMEGVSNANDWLRETNERLDALKQTEISAIDDRLEAEHPGLFIYGRDESPADGMFAGRVTRQVNPEMLGEYTRLRAEGEAAIESRYADRERILQREAWKFANADYWANMPVLFAEDLLVFGSFLKGSYSTGRIVNGMVKAGKTGAPVLSKGRMVAKVAGGLSKPFYEGAQEFIQESFNKTAQRRGAARLNSFYGEAFDPSVNADLAEGVLGYLQYAPKSIAEGFRDPNTMKQFWIGMLTAGIGMPSVSHVRDARGSRANAEYERMTPEQKQRWHEDNMKKSRVGRFLAEHTFQMKGEHIDAIREGIEEWREAQSLVKRYNEITSSDKFKALTEGIARGTVILRDMDNAVVNGDKRAYITEQEKQLLNIVDTFQRLGRTDELMDYVESFRNSDVQEIKEMTRDKDGRSRYDGVSDAELAKDVVKWGDALENTIRKYDEISRNLKTLYGENISDAVRTELTWQSFHLDNLNDRFSEVYGKVHGYLFGEKGVLNGVSESIFKDRYTDEEREAIERLRMTDARALMEVATSDEAFEILKDLGKVLNGNLEVNARYDQYMKDSEDLFKLYQERLNFANGYLSLAGDYENMELFDLDLLKEVTDYRTKLKADEALGKDSKIRTVRDLAIWLNSLDKADMYAVRDYLASHGYDNGMLNAAMDLLNGQNRLWAALTAIDRETPGYGRVRGALEDFFRLAENIGELEASVEAFTRDRSVGAAERDLMGKVWRKYKGVREAEATEEHDRRADERSKKDKGTHKRGGEKSKNAGKRRRSDENVDEKEKSDGKDKKDEKKPEETKPENPENPEKNESHENPENPAGPGAEGQNAAESSGQERDEGDGGEKNGGKGGKEKGGKKGRKSNDGSKADKGGRNGKSEDAGYGGGTSYRARNTALGGYGELLQTGPDGTTRSAGYFNLAENRKAGGFRSNSAMYKAIQDGSFNPSLVTDPKTIKVIGAMNSAAAFGNADYYNGDRSYIMVRFDDGGYAMLHRSGGAWRAYFGAEAERMRAQADYEAASAEKDRAAKDGDRMVNKAERDDADTPSPQLTGEERTEQQKANEEERRQEQVPAYTRFQHKGKTYAVFDTEHGRVFVDITGMTGQLDNRWIDGHTVRRAGELALLNEAFSNGAADENSHTGPVNDTRTEPAEDNVVDSERDEAERNRRDREDGTCGPLFDFGRKKSGKSSAAAVASTFTASQKEQLQNAAFMANMAQYGFGAADFASPQAFVEAWDRFAEANHGRRVTPSSSFSTADDLMDAIDNLFTCGL